MGKYNLMENFVPDPARGKLGGILPSIIQNKVESGDISDLSPVSGLLSGGEDSSGFGMLAGKLLPMLLNQNSSKDDSNTPKVISNDLPIPAVQLARMNKITPAGTILANLMQKRKEW